MTDGAAALTVTRLAVIGCTGRMGRAILRLASAAPDVRIAAAITAPDDPALGRPLQTLVAADAAPALTIGDTLPPECDVAIEFTAPDAAADWAARCAEAGVALVSGTTGLSAPQLDKMRAAASRVGILWSSNMSLGVAILRRLVREAAKRLADWDAEIVETHHRSKADAPSGTANALLREILEPRNAEGAEIRHGRSGTGLKRMSGEIGVHAVRMGGVVGDHDVRFASAEEVLTLSHRALSRDVFAAGALRAARWLHGRPAGWYTLDDVTQ